MISNQHDLIPNVTNPADIVRSREVKPPCWQARDARHHTDGGPVPYREYPGTACSYGGRYPKVVLNTCNETISCVVHHCYTNTHTHTLFQDAWLSPSTRHVCVYRPFFSFYALASTTHGSPSHAPQKRAVLTFHVVLLATHLKQTARALCANSRTLGEHPTAITDAVFCVDEGEIVRVSSPDVELIMTSRVSVETLLAECRVRLPILELSISHIATAFSASVRMDDQAASRAPVTTADERDTTQRALALSDLSSSTALVDSKTVSANADQNLLPKTASLRLLSTLSYLSL